MIRVSKHDSVNYECITYYIYAYQLRCAKQDVLGTIYASPKSRDMHKYNTLYTARYIACFDTKSL